MKKTETQKGETKKAEARKAARKPEALTAPEAPKPEAKPEAEAKAKPEAAPKSEAEAQAEALFKKYHAALAGLPYGFATEAEVASLKAALEEASKPSPEALEAAKVAKEAYSEAEKKAKAARAAFACGLPVTEAQAEEAEAEAEAKKAAWKVAEKAAKGFSFKGSGSGSRSKGPMSGIEAAYKILCESEKPMRCKELAEAAIDGGLWAPDGLTPEMTLSAAIQSEIKKKGEASRFVRTAPGLFSVRKPEAATQA